MNKETIQQQVKDLNSTMADPRFWTFVQDLINEVSAEAARLGVVFKPLLKLETNGLTVRFTPHGTADYDIMLESPNTGVTPRSVVWRVYEIHSWGANLSVYIDAAVVVDLHPDDRAILIAIGKVKTRVYEAHAYETIECEW